MSSSSQERSTSRQSDSPRQSSENTSSSIIHTFQPAGGPNNMISLFLRRAEYGTRPSNKHWLNWRVKGLLIALITYLLHAYAVYVMMNLLLPPWMQKDGRYYLGSIHTIVVSFLSVMAVVSHWIAMTTNPGTVPPDAKPLMNGKRGLNDRSKSKPSPGMSKEEKISGCEGPVEYNSKACKHCESFKPPRAHHCSICNRCIIKMDHHCPWVNNCVGIGNHKPFLLFCFYTWAVCMYTLALLIQRFSLCSIGNVSQGLRFRSSCVDQPWHWHAIWFLFLEASLFGAFTAAMMLKQARVVWTKVTRIDRKKKQHEQLRIFLQEGPSGVVEVFGGDGWFRIGWLLPWEQPHIPSLRTVNGYCH